MNKKTKDKIEEQRRIAKENNSLRFFYLGPLTFEFVGTRVCSNGSYQHTIKLPYSNLKTRSRYITEGDKNVMEKNKKTSISKSTHTKKQKMRTEKELWKLVLSEYEKHVDQDDLLGICDTIGELEFEGKLSGEEVEMLTVEMSSEKRKRTVFYTITGLKTPNNICTFFWRLRDSESRIKFLNNKIKNSK